VARDRKSFFEWCVENSQMKLIEQWDNVKNGDFTPENIAPGSEKVVWWICEKGHSYDMKINKRTKRGNGCPYCSGHRVLEGFNDLATTHPDLALQWDYDRNISLPTVYSKGSNEKVYWKCEHGHSWQASINERTGRNYGCPYCSGHRPITGETDLATVHPKICEEWDYAKNGDLRPENVLPKSNKKVWWKCNKCGNEWQTAIYHRAIGRGCPKCGQKKAALSQSTPPSIESSLQGVNPELSREWDYEYNSPLTPADVYPSSGKLVGWKCEEGHVWQATVNDRASGRGCPICSGRRILEGYNDLATTHPHLLNEWDFVKNIDLLPTEVSRGSDKKVSWRCKKGHIWKATIASRAAGTGCPYCAKELHISFQEKAIAFYLKEAGFEIEESYKPEWLGKSELDIYIPSLKVGIEYDGEAWHKSSRKDIKKDLDCFAHGVVLIRIREPKCPAISGAGPCYTLQDKKAESLNRAIEFIFDVLREEYGVIISDEINVDIAANRAKIYELMELNEKENSLGVLRPKIAKDWNYKKNESLIPEMVHEKSNKKVWWLCHTCGHEWEAVIASRVAGNGCPKCGKIKAALSRSIPELSNSLQMTNPELCKEWDFERNGELTPDKVFPYSNQQIWWKCKEGHQWMAAIANRSSGRGCPYCNGTVPMAGKNDLGTLFPDVALEWHPDKNGSLKVNEVLPGSDKKVWWKCKYGHEWEATISNRTSSKPTGCPICSGKKVLVGYNDLATTHPYLAKEWHPEKNGTLTCQDVTVGSNKKVWWKCSLGHEWEAVINSRKTGVRCPYCANKKIWKGFNDFETLYPKIAIQWHPELNGELLASDVFAGSAKKVWWKCPICGEAYIRGIQSQVKSKYCPICKGELHIDD